MDTYLHLYILDDLEKKIRDDYQGSPAQSDLLQKIAGLRAEFNRIRSLWIRDPDSRHLFLDLEVQSFEFASQYVPLDRISLKYDTAELKVTPRRVMDHLSKLFDLKIIPNSLSLYGVISRSSESMQFLDELVSYIESKRQGPLSLLAFDLPNTDEAFSKVAKLKARELDLQLREARGEGSSLLRRLKDLAEKIAADSVKYRFQSPQSMFKNFLVYANELCDNLPGLVCPCLANVRLIIFLQRNVSLFPDHRNQTGSCISASLISSNSGDWRFKGIRVDVFLPENNVPPTFAVDFLRLSRLTEILSMRIYENNHLVDQVMVPILCLSEKPVKTVSVSFKEVRGRHLKWLSLTISFILAG